MKKNSICCVIVTYNIGKKFYQCYNAIKNQVEKVVIVDNGSNNETLDMLKDIESNDEVSIIFNSENLGIAKALNQGIEIAIKETMRHEGIEGYLVSHGSSTVPQYIVDEINALGGELVNTYGIDVNQLIEAGHNGINKINVDTDIRLAVTRNMKELFARDKALQNSASIGAIYELLEKNKAAFDPRVFLPPIMDTVMYGNVPDDDVARICKCIEDGVKEVVGTLIVKFGSYGKAPKVEIVTLDEMAERYKKAGI